MFIKKKELGNKSFRTFSASSKDDSLMVSSVRFQEEIERIEAEAENFRIELIANFDKQLDKEKKYLKKVFLIIALELYKKSYEFCFNRVMRN